MTSPLQTYLSEIRARVEKATEGAWLIYYCADGTYNSHLVIGTKEDCRDALQKALWDGDDPSEVPDFVVDTLKSFMDPEDWGMDYGEWSETGEQFYIGVKVIRDLNGSPRTDIPRLLRIVERAVEAIAAEHCCGDPGVECDACKALAEIDAMARGEET